MALEVHTFLLERGSFSFHAGLTAPNLRLVLGCTALILLLYGWVRRLYR